MSSPFGLTLETSLPVQRAGDMSRDLLADLRRQPGVDAEQATRALEQGERSAEVPLLGQIVLTFLSAGAATALFGCLKAYIERDRHLKIRFRRPDGAELELDGTHFDARAINESVQVLERFLAR